MRINILTGICGNNVMYVSIETYFWVCKKYSLVQVICAKFEVICSLFYKSMKLVTIVQVRALNIFRNRAIAPNTSWLPLRPFYLVSAITKLCILCHISWTKHNTENVMSTCMFLWSSITMLPYTDSNAIMLTYLLTSLHLFCCTPVSCQQTSFWPLLLSLLLVYNLNAL